MPDSQLLYTNILSIIIPLLTFNSREMGNELVGLLEAEFNELYDTNDVIKIETKIRNIRFLGELTKFSVCSS